jgi:membrane protein required for beta-lactamase induction
MALISIILGLILDRIFRHLHELRELTWFEHYTHKISGFVKNNSGWVKLTAVLVLPMLAFISLQYLLFDFFWGLFYLAFSIVTLFFCLGPACLNNDIDAYLDARSLGDDDEALHYAAVLTERPASTAPDQQINDVIRAILSAANERIFSVLFWFVLLGPLGAMLYRLTSNICKQDKEDTSLLGAAGVLHASMTWAPARLLAIGYALTGHFDGAVHAYRNRPAEDDIGLSNYDVLVNTGLGALYQQEITDEISGVRSARGLVLRSILIWIAMLALLTLGGWLG